MGIIKFPTLMSSVICPLQVIPYDEWPDEFFPTNCWGVVYIMSHLVRNKLLQVFEDSDNDFSDHFDYNQGDDDDDP